MRGEPLSFARVATPLCPAGHLPLKGGDRKASPTPLFAQPLSWPKDRCESISSLEGEMSGRTEGGSHGHDGTGDHP
ncbi:cobaltochelatase CobN [Agrobacterium rubi]|nr:cobaltochelatase CobN [Agrobacterium rubi]